MKNIFNKYMLPLIFVLSASNATLPFGFEAKFDQDGVSVNGQNLQEQSSVKKLCTEIVLSLGGGWLATQWVKDKDCSANMKVGAIIAGSTLGSAASAALYGASTKEVLTTVGSTAGLIAGISLAQYGNKYYIKDSAAFGGKLGAALVSAVYKDAAATKVYAAQAVGEQLGAHLFDTQHLRLNNQVSEIGKAIGSGCGAAVVAENKETRNYFLKKALFHTVALQAMDKIPIDRIPNMHDSRMQLAIALGKTQLSGILSDKLLRRTT